MTEADTVSTRSRARPADAVHRPVFGVVCSGGGVTGAYQVGVLRYIHERFCDGERSPFRVFTGVSCGSINAAHCATLSHSAPSGTRLLEELWRQFHVPEYFQRGVGQLVRASILRRVLGRRKGGRRDWSALDSGPMWELFLRELPREPLEEAFRAGTTLGLGIAAKEATRNLTTWFVEGPGAVEWRRHHAVSRLTRVGPEHVVASCSVPFYFPPVEIDGRLYFDGAVHLERPFAAAISMGATRILGITSSVSRLEHASTPPAERPAGLETMLRSMLSVFNHDFMHSEVEQIEVANRFAEHLDRSTAPTPIRGAELNAVFDASYHPCQYVPIAVHLISPSRPLRELAAEFRASLGGRNLGAVPLGLLFHRELTPRLIELGYGDARAQDGRLAVFFRPGQDQSSGARARSVGTVG